MCVVVVVVVANPSWSSTAVPASRVCEHTRKSKKKKRFCLSLTLPQPQPTWEVHTFQKILGRGTVQPAFDTGKENPDFIVEATSIECDQRQSERRQTAFLCCL
ncbi:hypothetical protein CEXT_175701 [Caerostris extrusa]|uniref:Secreted protein n=1 Tax=Caerostris extrusa TaxID=172846 RepID=A0AAV4MB34_CAEEX|nr:hypothetical protein CEXT_175701 [Caerostris extrusa]